jgi:MoxR-like ATPase
MSDISFGTQVTLKQAAQIILSTPMNRYLLQGEPGIGKSSLLKTLSQALPEHEVSYIDVPNMDLGDIAMPVIDHETKTTRYYPNSRFKVHLGKPVITMLDEYTKGAEPIKNMLHQIGRAHV